MTEIMFSFRVSELRDCLKFLRIPVKSYRKAEMQQKISKYLDYVKNTQETMPSLFFNKIFQLESILKNKVDRRFKGARGQFLTASVQHKVSPFFETIHVLKTCMVDSNIKSITIDLKIPYNFLRRLSKKNRNFSYDVQILFGEFNDDWDFKEFKFQINKIPIKEAEKSPQIMYVTQYCSFRKSSKNIIELRFPSIEKELKVTVSLVKRLSPLQLLGQHRFKEGIRTPELLERYFAEKKTNICEIRLICPFEKKIMQYPCRSTLCNHPEVFDLMSFLNSAQYVLKLKCQVCGKPITFDSLELDMYFSRYTDVGKINFIFYKRRGQERQQTAADDEEIITLDES